MEAEVDFGREKVLKDHPSGILRIDEAVVGGPIHEHWIPVHILQLLLSLNFFVVDQKIVPHCGDKNDIANMRL